jgi:DNA-binding NarL/FixJ family response regulator
MLSGVQDPILVYVIAPPMVSWGLERLVQSAHPRMELAGTAASVDESLRALAQNAIDVVLLDLEGDDADQSVPILQAATRAKLLVLTGSHNVAMLDRAVLAGVRGVVRKSVAPSLLLKAIQKIHEGELWIDRGATGRIFMEIARRKAAEDPEKSKIATLTVRERRTIAAVTSHASLPAKVLADQLCISEHTLRNHLTSIYSKLGLTNRVDLYVFAKRYSLNEPNELYSAPRPKTGGHA